MNKEKLDIYKKNNSSVRGWFWADDLFAALNLYQVENNISGNLFEIGVYEGKSSILMGHMINSKETLSVCDLFENQKNSLTSQGNRDIFYNNMKKNFNKLDFLNIYNKDSKNLTTEEIGTNNRFFHIDGNHNAEYTLNDLFLANSSLNEKGIISIDDYFNHKKPGVSEGVMNFFKNSPDLAPFVIGYNKVCFSKKNIQNKYLSHILNPEMEYFDNLTKGGNKINITQFLNYNVAILPKN